MDIRQYISQLYDRGDDPWGLTGQRDDTMEMILAMLGQQDVPPEWMAPAEPPAPQQPADPAAAMWEQPAVQRWSELANTPSLWPSLNAFWYVPALNLPKFIGPLWPATAGWGRPSPS